MRKFTLAVLALAFGASGVLAQAGGSPPPLKAPKPQKSAWKIDPAHADISERKGTISTYTKRPEINPAFFSPNPEIEEERDYPDLSSGHITATEREDWGAIIGGDFANHVTRNLGLLQHSNWTPPDCDVAVNGFVVQVTNVRWAIYDKCGNQLFLETFATTLNSTNFLFDPKVIFDPWSQRFIMLIHSRNDTTNDSDMILLISDDANPNGNWDFYTFDVDTSTGGAAWGDYYEMTAGPTAVYIAGNQFTYASDSFTGAQLIIVDKADMVAGLATANSWESFPLTNSDATTTTSPRPAEMMWDPGATDMILVSNQWGGGDYVYLNRISDPLGARTQTKNRVDVGAYVNPPAAVQPGPDTLVDFNARVMNACFTADVTDGNSHHLWLSFMTGRNGNADVGARLINIDTSNHSLRLNSTFGSAGFDYIFPAIQGNYEGEGAVTFSRCSPTAGDFPENRYSTIEKDGAGGYDISGSILVEAGTGSYTEGNRWGDYFGGSLDWGDYLYGTPSGSDGKHKMWLYGQYAIDSNDYGTSLAATVLDAAVGVMAVTTNTTVNRVSQGAATGESWQFTLSNAGAVSYWWEVTSKPAWVNVSVDNSEVFRGDTDIVTFSTNATANSLAYGKHVGSITFRNCFNGATAVRTINLHVGDTIYPDWFDVVQGSFFTGLITDVRTSNNQYIRYFNDETSLQSEIWFRHDEGFDDIFNITCTWESKMDRGGMTERFYMWNWDTTAWVQFAGRVASITDSSWTPVNLYSANADAYTSAAGRMYMRVVQSPINDEDPSQDGWLSYVDRAYWFINP